MMRKRRKKQKNLMKGFLKINPFYFVAAALIFAGLGIFTSGPEITGNAIVEQDGVLEKTFICDGCKDDFIPSGIEVKIIVKVEIKENGKKVIGYFPRDWNLLNSAEARVEMVDDTYHRLEWNADEGMFQKECLIEVPSDITNPRFEFEIK